MTRPILGKVRLKDSSHQPSHGGEDNKHQAPGVWDPYLTAPEPQVHDGIKVSYHCQCKKCSKSNALFSPLLKVIACYLNLSR